MAVVVNLSLNLEQFYDLSTLFVKMTLEVCRRLDL